ncbi:hypothetical protein TNCV_3411751 [Trichonephila clavipes]|nr:hypothetical protein TNCV_3411751 [Trichonephila clavipes]
MDRIGDPCIVASPCKTIADPADCEVLFLTVRNVKPVETHCQFVEIDRENVMSDGMVGKWVRYFNDGWCTDVHDETLGRKVFCCQ